MARTAPCSTDTPEERPDDRRMHRHTAENTEILRHTTQLPRRRANPGTHARAHTQVRPRATRTSCTGTRAGPSAADCEKVAALTRHVYLLICINERLYPIPPASRGWGRCICPWRGTLNRTCIEVPPTLRGGQRWATKLGGLEVSERRDCSVGGLGSGRGEGNIGVL